MGAAGRERRARCARWAAVALAIALAGCPRVPPRDLSRDPEQLARQLREAQRRVQSVRGSARVAITSPSLSGSVQEVIVAQKPDRVRLETLDFFGNPAALLVAGGGRFAFLDVRAGVLYRGDATPENVSRLLPVVLPADELVTILCGSAPLLPGAAAGVSTDDGLLVLTLAAGDTTQRVAVGDAATVAWSRVRRTVPAAGGAPREIASAYDLEFHVLDRRGGVPFPAQVRLDAPAAASRVDLHWWDDVEVNAAVDAAVFRLEAPRGVRVVELAPGAAIPRFELPLEPPRRE